MNRLSIGRRIAIAFAATVVLLFSIDTTMACRFLWRSHCYRAPVVYHCPPACEVVTYSDCGSPAAQPRYPSTDMTPVPAMPGDQARELPPPDPIVEMPGDSLDNLAPAESVDDADVYDPPPNDLDAPLTDSPSDDAFDLPPADSDLPAADADFPAADDDLPAADLFPEDTTDDPGADLPPAEDDLNALFDEPDGDAGDALPGADGETTDEFDLPDADDAGLPEADDAELPGADDAGLPDDTGDSFDDLFNDTTEPAGDGGPRVADNGDDDVPAMDDDDLDSDLEDLGVDSDVNLDDADDLFPEDTDDLFPEDTDDLFPEETDDATDGDEDAASDDLDDLFGVTPKTSPRTAQAPVTSTTTASVQRPSAKVRTWVDDTGQYQTVAKLVKIGDSQVRLLKENGRFTTVHKRRLSQDDLAYITEMSRHMGIEILEHVARR